MQPCNNCSVRKIECVYSENARAAGASAAPRRPMPPRRDVQDRVAHLEGLVLALMRERDRLSTGGRSAVTGASADVDASANGSTDNGDVETAASGSNGINGVQDTITSFGRLRMEEGHSEYQGPDHWRALLEDIEEVKDYLRDEDEQFQHPADARLTDSSPYLLLSSSNSYSTSLSFGSL